MKDQPAFKPLQGNPTFYSVRESRYPLHVRQQIQGPSHIPIADGRLLLRCLWECGLPLKENLGNQLSSQDDMGCMELSSSFCAEIGVPIDETGVSGNLWSCPKEAKPMVLYDGEWGIALKPMQGIGRHFKLVWATPNYFTFLR